MALDLTFKPFIGSGIVTLYARNAAGAIVSGGYDLGEAPVFKISQQAPSTEIKTSRAPDRGTAFRYAQGKGAGLEIQLETLDDYTMSLLTSGVWEAVAGGAAVVGWSAPAGLIVGNVIKLPAQNVSAVTVKDSSGSPKTLPAGQYEVDLVGGTIKLLDITTGGAYVQPFKVDYTPGAVQVLGGLKAADTDYVVQLNGYNGYDSSRAIVQGYKFRFGAEGDMDWISEQHGKFTLRGSLLQDTTRASNAVGGQYYSITKP